ncbi:MAG: hypothetical protein IJ716_09615 [Lachnospiraceae bacterium]|nr:hypothetical protein [Lachnospiraceae bacterium]
MLTESTIIELYTPVVYVIFNRPDCVKRSFESIRNARPQKLFIIADGPREDHQDDRVLCDECRKIVENVDWDCEVFRNYADYNMGCGIRPASGFSWVFSHVDRAIIIEDDCVPSASFFEFCQEMLEKYKNDERVFSVSGMNFEFESDNNADYYFTHYNNTWGWATWKRVWDQYDFDIKAFSNSRTSEVFLSFMLEPEFVKFWKKHFQIAYEKKDRTAWDYQFSFLSFINKGLHIYPQTNLVAYLGFDNHATHTTSISKGDRLFYSTQQTYNIEFPVKHPAIVQADYRIDYLIMKEIFNVSASGMKICKELPDCFYEKIQRHSDIIVYGAGEVARDVIRLFGREHIDEFIVAVTQLEGEKYLIGNTVHELAELKHLKDKAIVVVAATKVYADGMVEELKRNGFRNYIRVIDYM